MFSLFFGCEVRPSMLQLFRVSLLLRWGALSVALRAPWHGREGICVRINIWMEGHMHG
jgi:hypothetical protein